MVAVTGLEPASLSAADFIECSHSVKTLWEVCCVCHSTTRPLINFCNDYISLSNSYRNIEIITISIVKYQFFPYSNSLTFCIGTEQEFLLSGAKLTEISVSKSLAIIKSLCVTP